MRSTKVPMKTLSKAVTDLHGCEASWVESVLVKEIFHGEIVWEGTVQVFDLSGHLTATRCDAWSYLLDETGKRKFVAVLHEGVVDSPRAAVRAAIAAEFRSKNS